MRKGRSHSLKGLTKHLNTRNRAILAIALPAIITNITTPILAMADLAIVGRLGSATYIGAIAVGSNLFNMVYWLLGFLRAGTSGLTAQAVGAGMTSRRDSIFYRGLIIGFLLGILALALSPLIAGIFVPFMEADAATSSLAETYFLTVIWGAPAYLASLAISGWLLGNQNSVATLKIAVFINISNILLSLFFVFVLGMKIKGVALGTCTSQWLGCIYGLRIALRQYRPAFSRWKAVFALPELKLFFRLNSDIFLRTLCLVAVTLWFTRTGAQAGPDILAANALLMQLFMLFSFFMDGFAYAGEAIAGKEFGAGNMAELRRLEAALMKWGLALSILGMAVYFLAGEWILRLLTEEESVMKVARDYLPWAVTIPLCGFMAFIYDGIFIGLSLTRKLLLSMLFAIAVFFATYLLLFPLWGNNALWLAFSLYLLTRGISQYFLLKKALPRGVNCHT